MQTPFIRKISGQISGQTPWPTLTEISKTPTSARYTLHITPTLPWFEGHFPDQPVLPGVTQTHWACMMAQDLFPLTGEFSQIKKLKFKSPILPDQYVTLDLRYNQDRNQVVFEYSEQQEVQISVQEKNPKKAFSSGTIQFSSTSA